MAVVIIEKPQPLISFEQAKAHLHVDSDEEQSDIEEKIAAATQHIDGPGGYLGIALMPQTLELRLDTFAGVLHTIALPFPPVTEILSVSYDDADGVAQEMDETGFRLIGKGDNAQRICPAFGKSWPSIRSDFEALRIRYRAGYASAEDVPAPIRAAVLLMVGDLYANRETVSVGAAASKITMSTTVEALLAPYRVWS